MLITCDKEECDGFSSSSSSDPKYVKCYVAFGVRCSHESQMFSEQDICWPIGGSVANNEYNDVENYDRFLYCKQNVNRATWLRPAAATRCVETFPTVIFDNGVYADLSSYRVVPKTGPKTAILQGSIRVWMRD